MQGLKFRLVRDEKARNKAVVCEDQGILPGEVISRVPALVTALLPRFKGERCDQCYRKREVKACSKCHAVWYCDGECQSIAWKAHHRKICGYLSKGFHLSPAYLAQDHEQQANGDLLLNLYGHMSSGELFSTLQWDGRAEDIEPDLLALSQNPTKCFVDLVSLPNTRPPPTLPQNLPVNHRDVLQMAWSRFDCNNFALHTISSLEPESGTYALGIFPLASRCFNHSCAPNAWCAFVLQERQAWLEVRALDRIEAEQEITIPYLDPALTLVERQTRLRHTYNFTCTCPKCTLEKRMPAPSAALGDSRFVEDSLVVLIFTDPSTFTVSNAGLPAFRQLSSSLACVRHEEFLKNLSKRFEDETHDGPYRAAWTTGRALLALCLLLYPRNYPLTAYYALELAKACWNAHLAQDSPPPYNSWLQAVLSVLDFAEPILRVVGGEEEESVAGGLATCETLRDLVHAE